MAQLVLGTVGAIVGGIFGGPAGASAGWAIGSAVGGMIGPGQKSSGPRLDDLKVTAASYGVGVPYIFGHPRVSGTIIWASEKRENATTESQGKGGGPEYTSYSYEIDILYLLSDNVIQGVRRIWSNGKLVWSMADQSDEETIEASEDAVTWRALRFYSGADDQMPDPTYEGAVGVGNAPAYIGRGTLMLEGVNLGASGQLPNLTFEIATSASEEIETFFLMPYKDTGNFDDVAPNPLSYTTYNPEKLSFFGGDGLVSSYPLIPDTTVPTQGSHVNYTGSKINEAFASGRPLTIDVKMRLGNFRGDFPGAQLPGDSIRAFAIRFGGEGVEFGWRVKVEGVSLFVLASSNGSVQQYIEFDNGGYNQGVFRINYEPSPPRVKFYYLGDEDADPQLLANFLYTTFLPQSIIVGAAGSGIVYDYVYQSVHGYYTPEKEQIPNEPVPLSEVVAALCDRCGVGAGQVDVSELQEQMVHALAVQPSPAATVLSQLSTAYYFECVESDKLYFRRRGSASVASIPYSDLEADSLLSIQEGNDLELPSQVNVTYLNLSNSYQQGNEVSDRLTSSSTASSNIQLALGLTPAAAKAIADTAVLDQVIAARTFSGALDSRYARLEPTDVVIVADSAGLTHRARIVRVSDASGVRTLELVADDARILKELGITGEDYEDDYVVVPVADTDLAILDIPLLRDQDDNPGVYAAGDGKRGQWPGYVLLRDGTQVGSSQAGAAMGRVTEALGDWQSLLVDEKNVITVTVNPGDQLSSITHADLATGISNYAAIGAAGRWEIVQFQRASLLSENVYRISGIARGRLGTEYLRGTHVAGDQFVLLDGAGMLRDVGNLADVGMLRTYKAVTQGARIDSGTTVSITPVWESLKPLSPVGARQLHQGNGDISIKWGRRTRYANNVLMGVLPLAEAAEAYEVDILDGGGTVVRTLASSTPAVTYTAEQQVADFGAQRASVSARIYQLSASVGRGHPASL